MYSLNVDIESLNPNWQGIGFKNQFLFKTILHHVALGLIFIKKSDMGHKLYEHSFRIL